MRIFRIVSFKRKRLVSNSKSASVKICFFKNTLQIGDGIFLASSYAEVIIFLDFFYRCNFIYILYTSKYTNRTLLNIQTVHF